MTSPPSFVSLLRNPVHAAAFGFGAGLAPIAPGTFGSLVALPLYWLLAPLAVPVYAALLALLFLVGVWVTARTERDLGVHDHSGIVLDEIVGQLVALFLAPLNLVWMLLGFGLFRLFDIWKPWPIRWLNDRMPGGWGIMLDDLAAGVAAALCLQGLMYVYGQ
jgi:phosphatidylglycerophosphatase A